MAQARADSGSDKETSACKRIATDETFVSIRLLATVSKTIFLRRALDTLYIAGRGANSKGTHYPDVGHSTFNIAEGTC